MIFAALGHKFKTKRRVMSSSLSYAKGKAVIFALCGVVVGFVDGFPVPSACCSTGVILLDLLTLSGKLAKGMLPTQSSIGRLLFLFLCGEGAGGVPSPPYCELKACFVRPVRDAPNLGFSSAAS